MFLQKNKAQDSEEVTVPRKCRRHGDRSSMWLSSVRGQRNIAEDLLVITLAPASSAIIDGKKSRVSQMRQAIFGLKGCSTGHRGYIYTLVLIGSTCSETASLVQMQSFYAPPHDARLRYLKPMLRSHWIVRTKSS